MAKSTAKVVITPQVASQVECLHNQVAEGKEWSGILLCKVTAGSIDDPANLCISAEEVFPMDFGDATFTSFDGDENWIKLFHKFPQIDPTKPKTEETKNWYIAKIHSHHSMSAFHSGTDTQDLYENAPKLPFFLSLVVNYRCRPFAEIAVAAESEETEIKRVKWSLLKGWKNKDNSFTKKKEKKAVAYIIPCDVVYEQNQWFVERLNELVEKNKKPTYEFARTHDYSSKSENFNRHEVPHKNLPQELTRAVVDNLGDLITLGANDDMMPFSAMNEVNRDVDYRSTVDYIKAFKFYFLNIWFPTYLENGKYRKFNKEYSHEDALKAIENFLSYHDSMWIHTYLKKAIDELRAEFKLQPV